ncbi:hypothetical protein F5Y10DRAFT_32149 [Nemania abortiva]|nr:hypothetical protein F5Y10DRAFT_32149 [Nemania abortiva]
MVARLRVNRVCLVCKDEAWETRRYKTTYTGAGPSVVMMGFRPSFFLFLLIAAPAAAAAEVEFVPFPLAPAIRGRVAEGAVGDVASMSAGAAADGFDTGTVAGVVAGAGAVSELILSFVPFMFATARRAELNSGIWIFRCHLRRDFARAQWRRWNFSLPFS